jgi:3D (Asp-Asp-Asp) domain-containing protein
MRTTLLRRGTLGVTTLVSLCLAIAASIVAERAMLGDHKAINEDVLPRAAFFNARPIHRVGVVRLRVTAYSPDAKSCGRFADGITASGYSVLTNAGHLVAADSKVFPFGAILTIPGYAQGNVVPVLDRGGAIRGPRADVLFPTHEEAMAWGVRHLDVEVWAYSDGRGLEFARPGH